MPDFDSITRAVRSLSDDIGRQVLSGKPQPKADIVGLAMDVQAGGPAKNASDLGMKVNDKLNDLHEYARIVNGGDGEYPIKDFVGAPDAVVKQPVPSDATIRRTTLEDELKRIYGQHATAVMDNIVKNQSPGTLGLEYPHPGGAARNLTDRKFIITLDRNHPEKATQSTAQPHVGYVALNPGQADKAGVPLGEILNHELGHLVGPGRQVKPLTQIKANEFFDDLLKHSPDEVRARAKSDPDFATAVARAVGHTKYTARPDELLANLAHMMRLEYGLTGKPVITPGDRIRSLLKWTSVTPRVNPNPGAKWMQFYGPDPILQHGPEAGNPAAGYEMMRQMFRNILEPAPGKTRSDVIKVMGSLGSTKEPKGDEVYG